MANNITFGGKTKNNAQWAREVGVSAAVFGKRVKKYGPHAALKMLTDDKTPVHGSGEPGKDRDMQPNEKEFLIIGTPSEPIAKDIDMQPSGKDNVIVDALGDEYVQKKISLGGEPGRELANGSRVRVYNKLNTNLHCTDCILPAQSEGSILASDLNHPSIAKNTLAMAE